MNFPSELKQKMDADAAERIRMTASEIRERTKEYFKAAQNGRECTAEESIGGAR